MMARGHRLKTISGLFNQGTYYRPGQPLQLKRSCLALPTTGTVGVWCLQPTPSEILKRSKLTKRALHRPNLRKYLGGIADSAANVSALKWQ